MAHQFEIPIQEKTKRFVFGKHESLKNPVLSEKG